MTGKAKKYFSCFGNLIHMYPVSVTFRGQYCATSSKPKNVHICTRLSGGIYCFFLITSHESVLKFNFDISMQLLFCFGGYYNIHKYTEIAEEQILQGNNSRS